MMTVRMLKTNVESLLHVHKTMGVLAAESRIITPGYGSFLNI